MSINNCYKQVRILRGRTSGNFFAKAVTCVSLICDYCREQIIATLKMKILYASNRLNMDQFFTLTTSGDYEDLINNFTILRKKMSDLQKTRFIFKARGKTQKEKESKYYNKIGEIVQFEILTMFFHRYATEEAITVARKKDVYYIMLNEGIDSRYRNQEDFIKQNYEEIMADVSHHLVEFKSAKKIFTYEIGNEQRLTFHTYEELYNYCYKKITKNEDEKFHFVRILEFAGKPHFHMLTNRYIPHYIMSSLLLGRKKPKVGIRDVVYLNKDLLEFSNFDNEIQAQEAVTKYVTEYITKELGEAVENYKKSYKGNKRLDIIKSSKGIDTALNTKFEEENENEEKYSLIDTYENKVPRSAWEQVDGNFLKYVAELPFAEDFEEDPFTLALKENYKDYYSKIKELSKYPRNSKEYKNNKQDIDLIFKSEKCRIETLYLKKELDKKLREKSIAINLNKSYLQDLEDPSKKIVFLLGNAGSGKTTTIANIYKYLDKNLKTKFAALSAKASSVLTEKGMDAKTIHRLCGARFAQVPTFNRGEGNPLECDIIFIDEISMVSKYIFGLLLNALPSHTKIVLLGDPNQINPVGSNNLIFELEQLNSPNISFNKLNINFRSKDEVAKIANQMKDGSLASLEFKEYNLDIIKDKIKQGYQIITNSVALSEEINLSMNTENKDITLTSFYNYHRDQEIMILRNDPKNKIYNGNICKIIGIENKNIYKEID